ncbi:serine--tRNA ligase [candidate division KSB1 bacterium]|nr:serine--tRNA ligase [candidate division KSB1 bacterium]NIR71244.1 serine--tRNA ligase [candidate division KSB1 bacterium]NIS26185.1 serine--tRNA ligase [candidate division KSB1 bacterium]NIT72963.1 serine--tRNA ligase [candidate division KSB1 bacterium]NIU26832.1 serine--tRNA ligase [candidate division KSB1 bacterium]
MLDLKFIRENLELVKEATNNKQEKVDLDQLIKLDGQRRDLLREVEGLKHQRNVESQKIGELKKKGQNPSEPIKRMQEVADNIKQLDEEIRTVETKIRDIQIWIPNIPHPDAPVGTSEKDNVEIKRWGKSPEMDFQPKPHWEVAEQLGIVEFGRGSKVAGAFFVNYSGIGAKLERALINFMLDFHIHEHGYHEVSPPFIVNRESMYTTGQLPKLEEDMYLAEVDDLFLIPTAEVPVTNLHRDEILKENQLPINYTAYTPCFRREAGSYGRDTRGLVRIHQFDKVEMVKFVKPEISYDELETLLADAEAVLQRLELPYRVIELCTADLSFAAAKCYDIEVWAPGVEKWLEVSSCSNFEAFQARRGNIRFRRESTGKTEFVHTLNGSGLALPRTVIALLENYQTDEGTVVVPEALREYVGVNIIK